MSIESVYMTTPSSPNVYRNVYTALYYEVGSHVFEKIKQCAQEPDDTRESKWRSLVSKWPTFFDEMGNEIWFDLDSSSELDC